MVGSIQIESRDIFSQQEAHQAPILLRAMRQGMNGLHVNTRRWVITQELLFAEGDPFVPEALAETERNLRSLGFLNEIQVTAIDTTDQGRVNILVSARESWSLNSAVAYTLASGGNQRWSLSLSDRNVLGYGFTMGAGLGADKISSFKNVWFRKRRVLGSRMLVGGHFGQPVYGHSHVVTVSRPFYALDDTWGLECLAWDSLSHSRYFLSNASTLGSDPTQEASLYADLPADRTGIEFSFRFRLGGSGPVTATELEADPPVDRNGSRIWRLGAGARILKIAYRTGDQTSWLLSDGRWADLSSLLDPGQPLTRTQGTEVFPYLHLGTRGRHWAQGRFVNNYGSIEDISLAWLMDLKLGPNGQAIGSNTAAGGSSYRAELGLIRFLRLGGGFLRLQGAGLAQTGAKENRMYHYNVMTGWTRATGSDRVPWLTRIHAEYGQGENLAPNKVFLLGLDRGIRTLEFDGMAGDRLARWNAEQGLVLPWTPLGLFKSGAAVFYSGGCAWWNDEDRDLGDARHEVGMGLRFGPTRSSRAQTTRLDLTWNLDDFSAGPVLTSVTRGTF